MSHEPTSIPPVHARIQVPSSERPGPPPNAPDPRPPDSGLQPPDNQLPPRHTPTQHRARSPTNPRSRQSSSNRCSARRAELRTAHPTRRPRPSVLGVSSSLIRSSVHAAQHRLRTKALPIHFTDQLTDSRTPKPPSRPLKRRFRNQKPDCGESILESRKFLPYAVMPAIMSAAQATARATRKLTPKTRNPPPHTVGWRKTPGQTRLTHGCTHNPRRFAQNSLAQHLDAHVRELVLADNLFGRGDLVRG